jgi:hypothetical protein
VIFMETEPFSIKNFSNSVSNSTLDINAYTYNSSNSFSASNPVVQAKQDYSQYLASRHAQEKQEELCESSHVLSVMTAIYCGIKHYRKQIGDMKLEALLFEKSKQDGLLTVSRQKIGRKEHRMSLLKKQFETASEKLCEQGIGCGVTEKNYVKFLKKHLEQLGEGLFELYREYAIAREACANIPLSPVAKEKSEEIVLIQQMLEEIETSRVPQIVERSDTNEMYISGYFITKTTVEYV